MRPLFPHLSEGLYRSQLPAAVLASLETPALAVFMGAVRHNIATMIRHCGGDASRWRPHLKTAKMAPVYRELVRAGVHSAKCATLREAESYLRVCEAEGVLAQADLLVAYPLVGPAVDRFLGLSAAYGGARGLSMLVEDPEAVADVDGAAADGSVKRRVGFWVDVNGGMDRTGIPVGAVDRVRRAVEAAGSRFRGLHLYEGHIGGPPGPERSDRAFRCYEAALALVDALRGGGLMPPGAGLITSGTPSFPEALAFFGGGARSGLPHQISPGTVVLHDARSEGQVPGAGLLPAALLLTRCVSRPRGGFATFDAGSKSVAAEAGDPVGVFLGHEDTRACTPSEEHLPVEVAEGEAPRRGELRLLVPRHVCPTVNLAETALLVHEGAGAGVERVEVDARAR